MPEMQYIICDAVVAVRLWQGVALMRKHETAYACKLHRGNDGIHCHAWDANQKQRFVQAKRSISQAGDDDPIGSVRAASARRVEREIVKGHKGTAQDCLNLHKGVKHPTLLGPILSKRFPASASSSQP